MAKLASPIWICTCNAGSLGRGEAAVPRGEDLAKQELDAILAAEQEAAAAVEAARARARDILALAEEKSAGTVRAAREEAQNQAEDIKRRALEAARSVEKQAAVQAASEIERIRKLAESHMDEAVKVVVQRIKESL